MSILLDWTSGISLLVGGLFCLVGGIGLLRMPDFFTRMHAASVTETLGVGLVLFGQLLQAGWTLVAVKLLCLPDECQTWQVRTMLRQVVRMPATLVRHARRLLARVEVPASWLVWWQNWLSRWWPGAGMAKPTG